MVEKKLEDILNTSTVIDNADVLAEYSGDLSFTPRVEPKLILKPRNAEEVQKVVQWANDELAPLVPVSSGPPHIRGDTIPSVVDSLIVDLSEMTNVIRVDRRNRVAMIEPGVAYGQLVPQLEKEGMRLNLPLLPRSNKSVIGSALEREPVIMPLYQWDALDPLTCIEVIFGTGDMFRTGSAAGPGSLEDQWAAKQAQVNPMGPGQTDFARVVQGAQGTMGIVTWSTIRCELIPTIQKPYLAVTDNLDALTAFVYRLLWLKLVDECLILNNCNLAAILTDNHEEYEKMKNSLPEWILFFSLAGFEYFPEERLAYQEKQMADAAEALDIRPVQNIAGIDANNLLNILSKPSGEPHWKQRNKGNSQEIFFLTTMNKTAEYVDIMNEISGKHGYPASDIGVYIQPMVQGTSCHCEFSLFYNPNEPTEVDMIKTLSNDVIGALMNAGAFFNRPYGEMARMAYEKDPETLAALKKIKSIFDPNGIMNPGKLCF